MVKIDTLAHAFGRSSRRRRRRLALARAPIAHAMKRGPTLGTLSTRRSTGAPLFGTILILHSNRVAQRQSQDFGPDWAIWLSYRRPWSIGSFFKSHPRSAVHA
jgi:hypothetical protein